MLSIVIPVYEMKGQGVQFLERALESIETQSYKDIEIVISDNSDDNAIKNLCKDFFVNYFRNPAKGMAANTNYGIDHATGDLIKILYQDDYLAHSEALQGIVDSFKDKWLITGTDTNPAPYWTEDIYKGNNKLGSPSALTISKEVDLRFNTDYKWVLDCEYYLRLWKKYGQPEILSDVNVIMGIGQHQETNNLTDEIKREEIEKLTKKYEN